MERNIKLKMGERIMSFLVHSSEEEALMRKSGEDINRLIEQFEIQHVGRPAMDKYVYVSMFQTMKKLSLEDENTKMTEELKALEAELESYLEGK